ncbi:BspA family leucine-rich repeat surface protein [uncultured Algibacter sp.]|uniref:BspA family leucine-rich repeat surface protein n=1 Tax=uncultured Algibacter sp. TaxID=298659 RepID=UPI0032178A16
MKNLLSFILLFACTSLFAQTGFTAIWDTQEMGSSGDDQITIPTNPAFTYNYTVDWGDGSLENNITGNITHTYASMGTYTVEITGDFPAIYFNNTGDKAKIIEILKWGNISWQSMENAFFGCENLNFDAIDAPDLSGVTSLKNMFLSCQVFNGIVNSWNISTITDISGMFSRTSFNRPVANWNTSAVTNMSRTFSSSRFNEPLDGWNTNAVTNMSQMFSSATAFNQNINSWRVNNVTNMSGMFGTAINYNQPLDNWDVGNVTDMSSMFADARKFNQNIDNWNTENVTNMQGMFDGNTNTDFNQPLNSWNVSNVENMSNMFVYCRNFNQPLDKWNVSKVTDMSHMFERANSFNQPIGNWNVSNVTDMSKMFFQCASFNQPLNQWNVGNVTDMNEMFNSCILFNQPLDLWNVSKVTDMEEMFIQNTVFNQPLNTWVTSSLTNIKAMFFRASEFNQPISSWDVSEVEEMTNFLRDASAFNQSLASWDITSATEMSNMLNNTSISKENYDETLISWADKNVKDDINLGALSLTYCDSRIKRQELIDNHNWTFNGDKVNCTFVLCTNITSPKDGDLNVPANSDIRWDRAPNADGYIISIRRENDAGTVLQVIYDKEDIGNTDGVTFTNEFIPGDNVFVTLTPYNNEGPATDCPEIRFKTIPSWVNSPDAFKLTFDTRNTDRSSSTANQLIIETARSFTYNYSIDWGDNQYDNNVTTEITHTYLNPGIYTISIIGDYPAHIYNRTDRDNKKLISVDQWGTQPWKSMEKAFWFCDNMEYNAPDVPDLSNVTSMARMFRRNKLFNGNINNWDVSNVINMDNMFYQTEIYNQPLDQWDVSKVTRMSDMFNSADAFNQPLNTWNVGNVTDMSDMFTRAESFNQPLNNWDVGSVTTMKKMFNYTLSFDQPLDNWNVEKVTTMEEMFDNAQQFNGAVNKWDVSNVTNMTSMFRSARSFNQPLDKWNVGNVTTMRNMFNRASVFNQLINTWDVTNVTNMGSMFNAASQFNQPLDLWDVSSVTSMSSMFSSATSFNQNINSWKVTNVIVMSSMFQNAVAFNQPLLNWDVNSVVFMNSIFQGATTFNQPIGNWNVSAVANMTSMFEDAVAFNQPLNSWNVSSVTLMGALFKGAIAFNNPINSWQVGSVTNMGFMFNEAVKFDHPLSNWGTSEVLIMESMFHDAKVFNQNIDTWDVDFVTTMEAMFEDAIAYNQPLNSWNVASVTTMENMFKNATVFNQDINSWNVRRVTTMEEMFSNATAFNQNLNNWRVTGVSNMDFMFNNALAYNQAMNQWDLGNVSMRFTFNNATSLNQYLGDWNVSNVTDMRDMLDNTALTRENYDNTLIAWSKQTLTNGITLGAEGLPYCDALEERQSMINNYGWTIQEDVLDCPIPACTQLISPKDNDTNVPVNTNIAWEPALFARGYNLTVGTSPGSNDIVNDITINNETSYEFATDFNIGDVVYVTITPFNDSGLPTQPCTEERFTISNDPATKPECTNLSQPINDATDVLVTTNLSWNTISNADGYKLTVGTTPKGTDILNLEDVGNLTTLDLDTNLPDDSNIYVTITPYNDQGDAENCTEEQFKTELIPVPPVCTNLTSPANNAMDVPVDANLTWEPVSNATGYLVNVGTTSKGVEIVNNIDVGNMTTYDIPEDLLEDRLYYVTIIPYNDTFDAKDCNEDEETFRTGNSTSPPSCTSLTSPTNITLPVSPDTNLTWTPVPKATGYKLTIGTTSGGTEIFTGDVNNITSYDPIVDFPESTTIYVKVTPYNINGDAINCPEVIFTTNGSPKCTTLKTPANLSTNIAVDTNIEWNPSNNAKGYKLTVIASRSTANNVTDLEITTGTTYNFPDNFEQGEMVTVTIIPYNDVGQPMTCTPESFTIIPPPSPVCTTLIAPANNAMDITPGTNIEWSASAGADGYKLTVLASSSIANNVTNLDITSGTTYNFLNTFKQGETVSVTIVPYNKTGNATGCTTESFTIKPVPVCTNLTAPTNGDVNVAINTNITWNTIADATGYKVTVLASNSTTNNGTFNVTTGNSYAFTNNFNQGETVTVTIVPYNDVGDAKGCTSERFTIKPIPSCTSLTAPKNEAIDLPLNTNITWNAISIANGYTLTVLASSSTVNNGTFDVTSGNSYAFPNDFEQGETVTVTITPYNEVGKAIGCTSERFTIKSAPTCTNLISPENGDFVPDVNEITWNAVDGADGYKLTINAADTTTNNETSLVVMGTTHIFPNDFNKREVVTVTIVPFNNVGDAIGCTPERFTIRPIPECTALITSLNEATDIAVTTDISWNESSDADGYRISIGTSPNGNDIVNNEDVASLTRYILTDNLPSETFIYVTIIPYNTSGDAVGCTSGRFLTELIAPECAIMTSPFNGETQVDENISIDWDEVEKTDGYRISIGTTPGGNDIVNNQDLGLTTSYQHTSEYPSGSEIFVNIVPYNAKGDALSCEEQSFTTVIPEDETKYGFSPDGDGVNEYWHIDNIENHPQNTVTIYNRWGDEVFKINGYDNASNAFRGIANKKTNMGANTLPSGTYFFHLQVSGNHNYKQLKGYLVLKR